MQELRHSLKFLKKRDYRRVVGRCFVTDNTTIAVLPADRDDRRLRLVMLSGGGAEAARLRLTDETYSPDVGWFAQGHIDLSPSQIRDLRTVLGAPATSSRPSPARANRRKIESSSVLRPEATLLSLHRAG